MERILRSLDLGVFLVVFVKVIELVEVGGQVNKISGRQIEHEALRWGLMGNEGIVGRVIGLLVAHL